ncbi:MAG: hypothetical protein JWR23_2960 [Mucilaginibacter sp.]|nr:hypothetical protein [Mucilaginibacter sp.]
MVCMWKTFMWLVIGDWSFVIGHLPMILIYGAVSKLVLQKSKQNIFFGYTSLRYFVTSSRTLGKNLPQTAKKAQRPQRPMVTLLLFTVNDF